MASEIRLGSSIQVKNGNLDHQTRPTAFIVDQTTIGGPTPGEITVTTTGVTVNLAQLTTPGWCRMLNLDPTNYVEVCLYDGTHTMPWGEMWPGEPCGPFRVSRWLGSEFSSGAGTALGTGPALSLRLKAVGGACKVLVECLEK